MLHTRIVILKYFFLIPKILKILHTQFEFFSTNIKILKLFFTWYKVYIIYPSIIAYDVNERFVLLENIKCPRSNITKYEKVNVLDVA